MKKTMKIIISLLFIFLTLLIIFYFMVVSPKKYEKDGLIFKLPHDFVDKGTFYSKEYSSNIFSSSKVYCSVNIESDNYTEQSYNYELDFLIKYYKSTKQTKQINGVNWDYISGTRDGVHNSFTEDIYLIPSNSKYYKVTIINADDTPCSLKDINTIVNSLKIKK